MTTITIEKDIKLDRYNFKTIDEFSYYIKTNNINESDIDFREEPIDNLDSKFLKKVAYAKEKPLSSFIEL